MKNDISNLIKQVTIIIPTINSSETFFCVKKCIENYPNIKILVISNNDDKKFKNKNVKVLLTNELSIGRKRNIGVKKSKTIFISFIDSDAFPSKTWLQSGIKSLIEDKSNKIGIVSGPELSPEKEGYSGKLVGIAKKSFLITINAKYRKNIFPNFFYSNFLPSVNWIMKKKIYLLNGQMNDNLRRHEDMDFVNKIKKLGYKILYNPKCIVFHRNGNYKTFFKKKFFYGYFIWGLMKEKKTFGSILLVLPFFFLIFLLTLPFIFISKIFLYVYAFVSLFFLLTCLYESFKVAGIKKYTIKIFLLIITGVILPGLGSLVRIFNNKSV